MRWSAGSHNQPGNWLNFNHAFNHPGNRRIILEFQKRRDSPALWSAPGMKLSRCKMLFQNEQLHSSEWKLLWNVTFNTTITFVSNFKSLENLSWSVRFHTFPDGAGFTPRWSPRCSVVVEAQNPPVAHPPPVKQKKKVGPLVGGGSGTSRPALLRDPGIITSSESLRLNFVFRGEI